ncbi:MAG: hypothetical protein ACR2QO_09970 [Acidimicrobiales bacterium]
MTTTTKITVGELADLLVETGHHHHQAYISSDGIDPEWALWYAGYLQTKLWDRAGIVPTRSSLIHLLVQAEKDFVATPEAPDWPPAYARMMLDSLS